MLDISKSSMIVNVISFTANVLITFITLYTAWLRFIRKRIDILSISSNHSIFEGDSLSLIIENKTLSNYTVSSVDFVFDNQYIMQICKYDEPFIIEPLKAYKISMQPVTYTYPKFSELMSGDMLRTQNNIILNTSSGKICLTKKRRKPFKLDIKYLFSLLPKRCIFNEDNFEKVSIHRNKFNDKVLSKDVNYVLVILLESGSYQDVLIDKSGFMSSDLFGINGLPEYAVKNFDSMVEYFRKEGQEKGLTFTLYDVEMNNKGLSYRFKPPVADKK